MRIPSRSSGDGSHSVSPSSRRLAEQDVGRLQVAVDDPGGVGGVRPPGRASRPARPPPAGASGVPASRSARLPPGTELQGEVRPARRARRPRTPGRCSGAAAGRPPRPRPGTGPASSGSARPRPRIILRATTRFSPDLAGLVDDPHPAAAEFARGSRTPGATATSAARPARATAPGVERANRARYDSSRSRYCGYPAATSSNAQPRVEPPAELVLGGDQVGGRLVRRQFREPGQVVARPGRLPGLDPELQVDVDELDQEPVVGRVGPVQVLLQGRIAAGQPVLLEPADQVFVFRVARVGPVSRAVGRTDRDGQVYGLGPIGRAARGRECGPADRARDRAPAIGSRVPLTGVPVVPPGACHVGGHTNLPPADCRNPGRRRPHECGRPDIRCNRDEVHNDTSDKGRGARPSRTGIPTITGVSVTSVVQDVVAATGSAASVGAVPPCSDAAGRSRCRAPAPAGGNPAHGSTAPAAFDTPRPSGARAVGRKESMQPRAPRAAPDGP